MVTFNPSEATRPISVSKITTSIRIGALPSPIYETKPFTVSCDLVLPIIHVPVSGKNINAYYIPVGGLAVLIGSTVTDASGVASFSVTIPTAGRYTILFEFLGDDTHSAVEAETPVFDVLVSYIDTALTISAPPSVPASESFTVSGVLTRVDTGAILSGQTINVSYDTVIIGSVVTAADGSYSISGAIPTTGSYTLKAEFPGAVGYAGSVGTAAIGIGEVVMPPLDLPVIGGIALAVVDAALIVYAVATQLQKP